VDFVRILFRQNGQQMGQTCTESCAVCRGYILIKEINKVEKKLHQFL